MDRRIQLSIISGFLGSGKTTFLQHKIFKKDHSSICIVINEAGDISIDDVLLDDKIEKIKISGGFLPLKNYRQMYGLNEFQRMVSTFQKPFELILHARRKWIFGYYRHATS